MASDQDFVEYVCEQAALGDAVTYRKMFGEYALYLEGKVVALVCDNQLFLRPTDEGRAVLGDPALHPPYPGARLHFRLDAELEDRDVLQSAFLATARALPMPKPKKSKKKKTTTTKKLGRKKPPTRKNRKKEST